MIRLSNLSCRSESCSLRHSRLCSRPCYASYERNRIDAVPLTHPRRIEIDQHAVVTLRIALCPCDFAGHDLSFGNRTRDAAPRVDQRRLSDAAQLYPVGGFVLASISSDYRLHRLLNHFSLPVEFLNTRIEIAIILCEFVCALLDLSHVNSRDVLHFRTCEPTLSNRSCLGQFGIGGTL
jgi:hypothetical protein